MNILFPFCGKTIGGSHKSSISLIDKLKKDHKLNIIINKKGPLEDYLKYQNIKYNLIHYPSYNTGNKYYIYLLKLPLIIIYVYLIFLKYKPDIIHINDIRTLITWLPIIIIFKKKIIYHHRNFLPNSKILYFFIKKMKIISTSKYLQKSLPKIIVSKVIYNPIDINEKIYKHYKKNNEITLGYFGNFTKQKNPEIFIQTAYLLKKNILIKCIMAGRYNESEKLRINKILKDKNMIKNFEIYNFQNDPYKLMKKCHFILCPSVKESFGRVAVESAILKIPVLAANEGGFKETIINNQTGFLIEDNDPKNYTNKIIELTNNPQFLNTIISNAYKNAKESFNIINHYNQIKEIYNTFK